MTQTTFNDNVLIQGSRDTAQLAVQAVAGQTQPLQLWENSSAGTLAQLNPDGRLLLGTSFGGAADALLQVVYGPTGSQPNGAWHAAGTVTSPGMPVNWVFHELQLAGNAGTQSLHNGLYTKITNGNTAFGTATEVRAATFQAINLNGNSSVPLGKVTGLQATATNSGTAYAGTLVGVAASLTNATAGSVNVGAAFAVIAPSNAGTISTLYGLQVSDLTQGVANYALFTGKGLVSFGDNVGVGTSSPSVPMHVYSTSTNTLARLEDNGAAAAYLSFKEDGTGGREYLVGSTANANGQGGGKFVIWDNSGGGNRLTIDSSGNLGLGGITTMTYLLDVNAGASNGLRIRGSGTAGISTYLGQASDTGDFQWRTNANLFPVSPDDTSKPQWAVRLSAAQDDFSIWRSPAGSTVNFAQFLEVNNSGDVGISVASPQATLHVANEAVIEAGGANLTATQVSFSSVFWGGLLVADAASGQYAGIAIGGNNRSSGGVIGGISFHSLQNNVGLSTDIGADVLALSEDSNSSNYGAHLTFSTRTGTSSIAERMRITGSGNVGIGTTSPTQLLSVGASSQLTVDSSGNLVTSGTGSFTTLTTSSLVGIGTGTASNIGLNVAPSGLSLTSQFGLSVTPTINSSATFEGVAVNVQTKVAASFTLSHGYGIVINDVSLGSGAGIQNDTGLYIGSITSGSSSNYAIATNAGLVSFGDSVYIASGKNLNLTAGNIVTDTTTGTKIGTATNQKLGFFNATPVTQPTAGGVTAGFTANSGTAMNSASTSTGGTGSSAYTFGDIVKALKNIGAIAA